MYEHLRNDFLLELQQKTLQDDEIRSILNVLDKVVINYEISQKSTELCVYEDTTYKIVKLYLASKKLEGLSSNSIELYSNFLRIFFNTVSHTIQEISTNEIRLFLAEYQMQRGISDRTLDKYRQILSGFFNWCVDEEYTSKNPCRNIKGIKFEVIPRKALTRFQLEQVRRACKTKRELAIVDVLYSTGCRVNELRNMTFDDIDYADNSVSIIGKGKKCNTVYLNDMARLSLDDYVNTRTDNSRYLFVSDYRPHGQISARTIESMFHRLGKELGIRLTPHVIRHTTATISLRNGMPITTVQKMLGHSSVNTTQIYTETSQEDVAISHKKVCGITCYYPLYMLYCSRNNYIEEYM